MGGGRIERCPLEDETGGMEVFTLRSRPTEVCSPATHLPARRSPLACRSNVAPEVPVKGGRPMTEFFTAVLVTVTAALLERLVLGLVRSALADRAPVLA